MYTFTAAHALINVTFTSPLLLDDWELLSRPAHYVTVSAVGDGAAACDVKVYFDVTAQVVVRDASTEVQFSSVDIDPSVNEEPLVLSPKTSAIQQALRIGASSQTPLSDAKDTPNWGDVYLTTVPSPGVDLSLTFNWVRPLTSFDSQSVSRHLPGNQLPPCLLPVGRCTLLLPAPFPLPPHPFYHSLLWIPRPFWN